MSAPVIVAVGSSLQCCAVKIFIGQPGLSKGCYALFVCTRSTAIVQIDIGKECGLRLAYWVDQEW
jgi:hypothetical protein